MVVLDVIQRTGDARWPMAPRAAAGLPLLLIGLAQFAGALPSTEIMRSAKFPMAETLGALGPLVQVAAGLMLLSGWMTRVGGVLGALAMGGAITAHIIIPDDRWPQAGSGLPGPEPLGAFVLAWLVLGGAITSVVFGSGVWGLDRGQVARRASMRGGGMNDVPRVKKVKQKKGEPPGEGESVW